MACNNVLDVLCTETYMEATSEYRNDCPSCLWNSGILRRTAKADAIAQGQGWSTNAIFWSFNSNLAPTAVVPELDGPCPASNTIGQKEQTIRVLQRHAVWEADDIIDSCNMAEGDLNSAVLDSISQYTVDIRELDIASTLRGIVESELALGLDANNQPLSPLIIDADDAALNPADPGHINNDMLIEASKVLGCNHNQLTGMITHTNTFGDLRKQEQIDFIQPSCTERDSCLTSGLPVYNGKRVIECENPCLQLADGRYVTVLFRDGAFAYGEGQAKTPFERFRDPCKDNGSGGDTIHVRDKYVIMPVGFSNQWTPAGQEFCPTSAELKLPATWCLARDYRNVGLTFIISSS